MEMYTESQQELRRIKTQLEIKNDLLYVVNVFYAIWMS